MKQDEGETLPPRPSVARFDEGRELAVQVLKEGAALLPSDRAAIERKYHPDRYQENFVYPYLLKLLQDRD
jgi:hypothetical protein